MAIRTRFATVDVYDTQIASLFNTAGDVGTRARADYRAIIRAADIYAPVGGTRSAPSRSRGQRPIRGAHRARYVPRSAAFSASYFVENQSDHAVYVHEGVYQSIQADSGLLKVHFGTARGGKVAYMKRVDGQRANPWLYRAANSHMIRNYGVAVPR